MNNVDQTEEFSARNPLVKAVAVARSPSPSNMFPGNRLPGSSGTTSAVAQSPTAMQTPPELSGQHPLISGVQPSNAGAGRGSINPAFADPTKGMPTMASSAPAAANAMTDWNRSGMTNAQVAQANPGGQVKMTRQPNGTMAFSGSNVTGPVSYMDGGGNALAGAGIRGNGFSRVDSAAPGANVAFGPNGSYGVASANPMVGGGDGSAAPASQPARINASAAASGAVDAALAAAMQRGDVDAVRQHYAGRGQGFGGQSAAQIQQEQDGPKGAIIGGSTFGFDPAKRNAQFDRDQLNRTLMDPNTKRSMRTALPSLAQTDAQSQSNAQRLAAEERMGAVSNAAAMERASMQEQGDNQRQLSQMMLKQQDESRTSAYQAAQLDFSQQRLALERERAGRDGLPQGYRSTADGKGLEAIPGGPADPAVIQGKATLNDVQSKALQFGARMLQSGQSLDQLAAEGVTQPGLIKRAADTVGAGALLNWSQSPRQQAVEQSQRDYVNAVLRRESGAAISNSEFDNARKQYFPQPGDSAQVIEQKRRNRDLATQGILAEVPNQQNRVQQVLGAAGQAGGQAAQRTVVRTGTANGRKVLQYSDGSIGYAD